MWALSERQTAVAEELLRNGADAETRFKERLHPADVRRPERRRGNGAPADQRRWRLNEVRRAAAATPR